MGSITITANRKLLSHFRKSTMVLVKAWLIKLCLPGVLLGAAAAVNAKSEALVRRIILSCQHLGAHGMGYNTRSMTQLSQRLTPADIPTLLTLAGHGSDVLIGAEFALASQCEPAILPLRDAAEQRKIDFLDARDAMSLMADFAGCSPQTRTKAANMQALLTQMQQENNIRIQQEFEQRTPNDARIQANALKLLDSQLAKTLTREERLEIFHRSLAAMGLREDGQMTPKQRQLVDRMYRSMVLGQVKTPPNR